MVRQRILQLLRQHWLIIVIYFLAVAVRFYTIHSNSVMFWYDQARDFTVVQSMSQGDVKIQGPSASGTNDSIYHGVFYYYLILPAFILGGGSPVAVAQFLAIIGSLSIFVIYRLSITIFKSKEIGLLAALLLACSFLNIHLTVWLSNPQILSVTVGIYYLYVWKLFFEKHTKLDFVIFGISLGLCIQAGVFELYLLGVVSIAYFYFVLQKKRLLLFKIRDIVYATGSFLITISTMIITQLLMVKRGILTVTNTSTMENHTANSIEVLPNIFKLYLENLHTLLTPDGLILAFLLLCIVIYIGFTRTTRTQREWLLLMYTAPLVLLLIQFRDSAHLYVGFEIIYYILFAAGILHIKNSLFQGKVISLCLLAVFVTINIVTLTQWKQNRSHFYTIQKGALLNEQLALIDKTYEIAHGENFTFSAVTIPYNVNVTWSYLYNWYGKQKYGYIPEFIGGSQVGIVGEGGLPEVTKAASKHFTIIEPDNQLATKIYTEFMSEQIAKSGTPSAELSFGSLLLQIRDTGSPAPENQGTY